MIGTSIAIKGEITGEEDLLVQGKVEGSIRLNGNELSIGDSGQVSADINAASVRIEGTVTGDVTGTEKVVIAASGQVQGNIVAPRVTLEDGAQFKGSIDMDPGSNSDRVAPLNQKSSAISPTTEDDTPSLDIKSG